MNDQDQLADLLAWQSSARRIVEAPEMTRQQATSAIQRSLQVGESPRIGLLLLLAESRLALGMNISEDLRSIAARLNDSAADEPARRAYFELQSKTAFIVGSFEEAHAWLQRAQDVSG